MEILEEPPNITSSSLESGNDDVTDIKYDTENRPYQEEMVDRALKENIICALGTGTGKTQIAISLIKRLLYQIDRDWDSGGQRTVIVAPSTALVEQHTKYVERWMGVPVKGYHDSNSSVVGTKTLWDDEFRTYKILVMGPDILKYLLLHGLLDLARINLLIFDECHHAVDNHSYRDIMRYIHGRPGNEKPRLLGLTASVVNCKLKSGDANAEMEKLIFGLVSCLGAKVCTSVDESLKEHEEKPSVSVITYETQLIEEPAKEAESFVTYMIDWFCTAKKQLQKVEGGAQKNRKSLTCMAQTDERFRLSINRSIGLAIFSLRQLTETLRFLGPWCAYQVACMVKRDFELLVKNSCLHKEMASPFMGAVSQIHMFATTLEIEYGVHKVLRGDVDRALQLTSPKVQKLVEIFRTNRPPGNEESLDGLRCIVFVGSRFNVWALNKFFEFLTWKPGGEFRFLRSGYLVGQLTPEGGEIGNPHRIPLGYRQRQTTLNKFRQGVINLLFATNVVEEGLDVLSCNLIVRFDRLTNYCSYLQSKGCARAANSKFLVLAEEGRERDFVVDDLKAYDTMDKIIKKTCINREIPGINIQIHHFADKPILSFTPPGANAVVTLNSALSVLHRYCLTLPHERGFSVIRGQFLDTGRNDIFIYRIFMTLNSAIKRPVTGPPVRTRKLAKQAAALECCRLLYECGQLDANLLPFECNWRDDMTFILRGVQHEDFLEGAAVPGTKRRRQYYLKQTASLLQHCRPEPAHKLFLYSVVFQPDQEFCPDTFSSFVLNNAHSLGLLSRSEIPSIPPFSVFFNKSSFQIQLQLISSVLEVSSAELVNIQHFHCAAYEQVMKFSEAIALHFKPEIDAEVIYAVPLILNEQSHLSIDFALIERVEEPSQYVVISQPDEQRKRKVINADAYRDGIVTRWYKTDDDRFCVLDVRSDLSPTSKMNLDDFSSLAEYFERKYGIEVQQLDQPILQSRYCPKRLNLLWFPNGKLNEETAKKSKVKLRRDEGMLLIPELCQLFPFPATLYFKCMVLPSLMHRLRWFCHCLHLRNRWRLEIGIGSALEEHTPPNWPALFYDAQLNLRLKRTDEKFGEPLEKNDFAVAFGRTPDVQFSTGNQDAVSQSEIESPNTSIPAVESDLPDDFGLIYAMYERDRFFCMNNPQDEKVAAKNKNQLAVMKAGSSSRKLNQCGCSPDLCEWPYRIDSDLLVDVTQLSLPDLNQILPALTGVKANDGFNLERLEVLGDSFLKLTSCIYVFFRFPNYHEGHLTQFCDQQISNFVLYSLAKKKGLHNFVCNQIFDPTETFVPPGYIFDEKESEEFLANSGTKADKFPSYRVWQSIDDKTIADVIEALIGMFFINSGPRSAQLFMSWVGLHVLPEREHVSGNIVTTAEKFGFFTKNSILSPLLRNDPEVEVELNRLAAGLDDFEARIGYKFRNKAFLLQAFTHSSYDPNELTDCYQRLEFLGDAIIDFMITRYVYEDRRSFSPGVISDMRSALVNNLTFSILAVKYNYHSHIRFRSLHLYSMIDEFVLDVQAKNEDVIPLEEDMLFYNFDDSSTSEISGYEEPEAPKALGDVFEAVAGAIFLDSDLSLDTVWKVYYNIMRPTIEQCINNCPRNPVRELMEMVGPNSLFSPPESLGNGRCTMQVTVLGKGTYTGKGRNSRAAKCNAAKAALIELKKMANVSNTK